MNMEFLPLFNLENYFKTLFYISEHFLYKSQKFEQIAASLILKFEEIGALQNSGNLLKIWRDWSLPFGEIEVPHLNCLLAPLFLSQFSAKSQNLQKEHTNLAPFLNFYPS